MEALEEYGRIDGHNLDFNPAKCTWKEVIEELNLAHLAAYSCERRENTFYGKTRNVVNNTIQIVEPALDALPDYLCILQGGLAIVFNASISGNNIYELTIIDGHSLCSVGREIGSGYSTFLGIYQALFQPRAPSRSSFLMTKSFMISSMS
jgi:hypothetical protein